MFLLMQKRFKINDPLPLGRGSFILSPSHTCRLFLVNNNVLKECDRFSESLVDGHKRILVLDRKNSVISTETEIGHKVSPIGLSVTVANGTEYPRAVIDVDAYTGGFNLQIAFSTGYLAGKSAAEI